MQIMFQIICFAIALCILALFSFLAYKNRRNMSVAISRILLGVLFSTFFMVLPTKWIKEGQVVFSAPLYSVLSSLLYSLKTIGGRQDIGQLESMALPHALMGIYIVVNYACFALTPIITSSLILSFMGDTGERIRLFFRHGPKCYVFSEVNENALSLADGLQRKSGKKTIVFCDGRSADKALVAQAKKLGAIVLSKPCDALRLTKRFGLYDFCLISPCEDSNIQAAEALIVKHSGYKQANILINAFVESGVNVSLLENVLKSRSSNENIQLCCIDEIALFCNQLIYNHPLYNTKNHGKHISVAIVGCGRTGMRMLKTAYWAGQIDGYSLKIRVYDKSAHAYREDFYRQCPGLKDDPTIQFVQTDVCSASFHEQLLAPENSAYATYIVVAMGSDQLNLSVSNELFKAYRRHTGFDDSKMPEIFTRIRAQAKSEPYFHNAEFLEKRHIHLFGSTASIFSDKTIFDTELENLAFAVHLTYQGALQLDPESEDYRTVANSFKTSEYDRRSSMAVALHIPAKLCMCDKIVNTGKNNVTPENIRIFAECLKSDPNLPERLARNEHDRWNAFMLSEGYQPASVEEMHLYAGTVGNNRDDLTKLHPCIAPWDALDELENIYNDTYHKHKRYKEYDYIIVKSVPDIWAAAQKMGEKV